MTPERLAEIRSWLAEWTSRNQANTYKSAPAAVGELLAEVDRLTAERAVLTGQLQASRREVERLQRERDVARGQVVAVCDELEGGL